MSFNEEVIGSGAMYGEQAPPRRLAKLHIGDAVVYIEPVGGPVTVGNEDDDEKLFAAGAQSYDDIKDNAFDSALVAVRESIRSMGKHLRDISTDLRPQETTVEFSLTFDVKGRATPIPLFITAESKLHTGLKVTATWRSGVDPIVDAVSNGVSEADEQI